MAKIGIIGSGNVGANTAFFIAEKAVADVVLYDIREGLSPGKALDMMEAAPIRRYRTKISGTDSMDEVKDSDILIITAGGVRGPGMKRADLYEKNRPIIEEIAKPNHRVQGFRCRDRVVGRIHNLGEDRLWIDFADQAQKLGSSYPDDHRVVCKQRPHIGGKRFGFRPECSANHRRPVANHSVLRLKRQPQPGPSFIKR